MDQLLYKYLVLHGHLAVPQMGVFSVKKQTAGFDVVSGLLTAPQLQVQFNNELQLVAEKSVFDFLVRETGKEETVAIRDFQDFANRFQEGLRQNKTYNWNGVGTLFQEENGPIRFEAAADLLYLLPPVAVEGMTASSSEEITEETDETVQRDLWWFYAIILLLLGLGALAYYYI